MMTCTSYVIFNVITGKVVDPIELAKDWEERGKQFKWKELFEGGFCDLKILPHDTVIPIKKRTVKSVDKCPENLSMHGLTNAEAQAWIEQEPNYPNKL
jgi:hypothetical protein